MSKQKLLLNVLQNDVQFQRWHTQLAILLKSSIFRRHFSAAALLEFYLSYPSFPTHFKFHYCFQTKRLEIQLPMPVVASLTPCPLSAASLTTNHLRKLDLPINNFILASDTISRGWDLRNIMDITLVTRSPSCE